MSVCVCLSEREGDRDRQKESEVYKVWKWSPGLEVGPHVCSSTFPWPDFSCSLIKCKVCETDTLSVCPETQTLVNDSFLCHKVTVKTHQSLSSTIPGIPGNAKATKKKMHRGVQ